jgi:hypothetical protein
MISGCVTVDSEGSGIFSGRITDVFKRPEVISSRVVLCLRRTGTVVARKRPVLVCSFSVNARAEMGSGRVQPETTRCLAWDFGSSDRSRQELPETRL